MDWHVYAPRFFAPREKGCENLKKETSDQIFHILALISFQKEDLCLEIVCEFIWVF